MSHAGLILGLPELEVERVDRNDAISAATTERWYQSYCRARISEMSNRDCPKVLGIDEHFFSRKKGYATTLVDLHRNKVFDVRLGRSEASLHRYLRRLPGKDNVKLIVMDLSETYRSIARQHFPRAKIVADRFHVVRLVNQHFLNAWKDVDPEGRRNRGLISLVRRHKWNLSPEKHANLQRYLSDYPGLHALYEARQKLNRLLLLRNLRKPRAQQKLPILLKLIEQLRQSPLRQLAKTLTSWLAPIVMMWRSHKSNGPTEEFHTKMEMMSRRAYGFKHFENFRMRVMTHCG